MSRTFAHRIVELEPRQDGIAVRTRGNANVCADPAMLVITSPRATVVVGRIPVVGHGALVLNDARPRALLLLLMLILLGVALRRSVLAAR